MSEKCQIDNNCTECVAYQCPCRPIPVLLCKKHLENHLITPSNNRHNIKPLILQISDESRKIILSEI